MAACIARGAEAPQGDIQRSIETLGGTVVRGADGNIVEVSVQGVSWSWLAPLSGSYGGGVPFFRSSTPITLNVYSSDILGGYPAGVNSVTE